MHAKEQPRQKGSCPKPGFLVKVSAVERDQRGLTKQSSPARLREAFARERLMTRQERLKATRSHFFPLTGRKIE